MKNSNLLSLSFGRIVRKDITGNEGLLPESFETYQIVRRGDIVLRLTDLQNDQKSLRSGLVEETGIITSAYLALKLRDVEPRFFAYQMRAVDIVKVFYSMGGGLRQSVGYDDLKRLVVIAPSIGEQTAIADYLDRETAQIDTFIAKCEALLSILRERRSALITTAVAAHIRSAEGSTQSMEQRKRGLGVRTHAPLRRLVTLVTSGSRGWGEFYDVDGADVFLRIGDLQRASLALRPVPRQRVSLPTGTEGQRTRTRAGDLLVSITADLGSVAVIDPEDAGAYVSQHVALVRVAPDCLLPRFLAYFISSGVGRAQLHAAAYGGTKTQLSLPDLKELEIPLVSPDKQRALIESLDIATADIDAAVSAAEATAVLARERRSALVSAAVTGKINLGIAA